MRDVVNLLVYFIEVAILLKYLMVILPFKHTQKHKYLLVFLLGLLGSVFKIFLQNQVLDTAIFYIIIFIVINLFFDGVVYKKIIAFGSFLLVNIAIENVIVIMFFNIFDVSISQILGEPRYNILAIFLSKLILYIWVSYYSLKNNNNKYHSIIISDKKLIIEITSLFLLAVFVLILLLSIYIEFELDQSDIFINWHVIFICFSGVCVLCVNIYNSIMKVYNKQMELNLIIQKKQIEYKNNVEINITIESIRAIKHDMANHLSVISGYIKCEHSDDALDYIKNLSQPLQAIDELLAINHPVVSSILCSKTMLARKRNIEIKIKNELVSDIKVNDIDLTILLGNVLDNAIEACMNVNDKEKLIKVHILTNKDNFILECTNTMNSNYIKIEEDKFITSKGDKINHGIGLKNIQSIVKKHFGDVNIKIEDNMFKIETILKNKSI
ncbi:MAG: sensor histidine kinase [Eubacteriaceae bacterium]